MDSILVSQLNALTTDVSDPVTNLANAAALLMQTCPQVSWAGFYRYRPQSDDLLLGPYQGKLACNVIPNGKGVCGTVCQTKQVQVVPDVNKFPGHIACDSASRSEIVVPITQGRRLRGVLDLDSNQLNAFTESDQKVLEKFVRVLVKNCK